MGNVSTLTTNFMAKVKKNILMILKSIAWTLLVNLIILSRIMIRN